ncbi:efflux transporter periplasmic adaptor subunit [Arachidicoccus ginsenosidimutans]|uniref:efflux RND transporter periplasmic adaptor subunit n=1 Tax=Arachidicoccus sp. BS20 TaxID=1850526 RepID=UPI0007F10A35|nr:efflux RND transporter periplasmic adaptor subunit [Arachidicoccus sp. BS20]ANI90460.1 efflux transporter periplasmic adaptor subunit [Arachidicoccus sp. BS20]
MKRKNIIILLIILLAAVSIWYFFFRTKAKVTTYQTEKVHIGHIAETVTATGTVQPVDTVAVGTQVSGTVAHLYADFNSVVKKGQLLAVLDQTLFQASVQQAQGNLANAQSQLNYQQQNYNRQKQLLDVGAISRADYDNAYASYQSAKAQVEASEGSLKSAQKNLQLSTIYSPIDGTVLSRNVSEGQTVAASFSTPTLFTIAKDLTKMQVLASVDQADVGNIKDSERATFTVDAFLNDKFEGKIKEIRLNPVTSSNVVTYSTIIDAPNKDLKLKPGMTTNIIIYTSEADSALLISEKAVKYTPNTTAIPKEDTLVSLNDTAQLANDERYVWVLQGHKIIQKKIKVGLDDNTKVQVLDGLTPHDIVITGESQVTAKEAETEASSPFMPHRPGGKGGRR